MLLNRERINRCLLWPVKDQSGTQRQLAVGFALVLSLLVGTAISTNMRPLVSSALWLSLSVVAYLVFYYVVVLFFGALTESAAELQLSERRTSQDTDQDDFGRSLVSLVRIVACGGLALIGLLATIGNVRALYGSTDMSSLFAAIAGTASLTIIAATGTVSFSLVGRPRLVLFFISGNAICFLLAFLSLALQPSSLASFVAGWCVLLIVIPLLRANYWWAGGRTG
jgi:hypothetical protein